MAEKELEVNLLSIELKDTQNTLQRKENEYDYLKEYVEAQKNMFIQTSEYMAKVIEENELQKEQVKQKNQQLRRKNKKIKLQSEELRSTIKKLLDNNDEIEMQKQYLEAMIKELQDNNDEIEMQKQYLEVTIKELEKSEIELSQQKKIIEDAFGEIDLAYSDITASINYAQRIQEAMLPNTNILKSFTKDAFIFYQPKDIVSGDFYWFQVEGERIVIIAADCTGHGVPGALMSMLCINLIREFTRTKKTISPAKLLNYLDKGLNIILKQNADGNNNDGMDAAVCIIDKNQKTIKYAGAHNPLILIKDGELIEYKADKRGVGGYKERQIAKNFTDQTIMLSDQSDYTIYMYSDGYQDQFGGLRGRRFMSSRLKELLLNIHQKNCQEQIEIIENNLEEWLNGAQQIDDILVMGIKI
ncbi:MAG: hypothetical protein EAZ55_03740 [Cytophagales bacterium]|nr:MAG: hypothetical protein EAZ55_03740 [Cytophagales bacterium]